MKIKLTNARQHTNLELDLPDSGVIMIQGSSGNGKTTILDSIKEALFGSVSDFQTWGTNKSSVELVLNAPSYLKITRNRGPHSLVVEDGSGKIYNDEEAQILISKVIGMSELEFSSCSYIEQMSANSLLNLTPTEQLKFVERLSGGYEDVEIFKKKISDKIKRLSSEAQDLSYQLSAAITSLSESKSLMTEISEKTKKPVSTPEQIESGLLKATTKKTELAEERKRKLSEIKKAKDLITSKEYELVRKKDQKKIELNGVLSGLRESLASELSCFGEKPWSEDEKRAAEETLCVLDKQKQYLGTVKEMKALAAEVYAEYKTEKGINLIELLKSESASLSERIGLALNERSEKNKNLIELSNKNPQYCPSCSAPLTVISGKITGMEDIPKNLVEVKAQLSDLIKGLSLEISEDEMRLKRINEWIYKASSLKAKLPAQAPDISIKTMEELLEKYEKTSSYIREQNLATSLYNERSVRISSIEKKIALTEKEILDFEQSVESITMAEGYIEEKSLILKISAAEEEAELIGETLDSITSVERDLILEKNEHTLYNSAIENYKRVELVHKKNEGLKKEIDAKIKDISERIAAATRLKELSDMSAVAAIENTIDAINASAEQYVNKMFADSGTVITLKNTSQTKSGEERAKISTDIFHKGKQAKRLSNLSGGEKSRASLAFQLGLSDMYGSKLLMVDEGFAGLGEDDKRECLEVLREAAGDKLVLVVEHGAPESFFDSVIRV